MPDSSIDDFLGMRPSARWRRRAQWLAAALAVIALIVLVGRFVNGGEVTQYATASVERGDLRLAVIGAGQLQPAGERPLTAGVAGVVGQMLPQSGDAVGAGQTLARLDPAPVTAAIARAQQLIGAREATVAAAAAQERELRDQLSRFERVRRQSDNRVPSDREMSATRDELRQAADRLRDAQTELEAAHTALAARQAELAATEVRAPADGVIVRRLAEPGETLAAPGEALFELAAPVTRLRLDVMVDRAAAEALRIGGAARVSASAAPGKALAARVIAVRQARSADTTRMVVSLDVQNPDRLLQPGMLVTAEIDRGVLKDALTVTEEALAFARASDAKANGAGREQAVYVLGAQGAPRRVPVTLAGGDGRRQAVVSPELQPGTLVITGLR